MANEKDLYNNRNLIFKNFRSREAWFNSSTAPQLYWVHNSLNATVLIDGKARKVDSPESGDLPEYYLEGEKMDAILEIALSFKLGSTEDLPNHTCKNHSFFPFLSKDNKSKKSGRIKC